MARFQSRFQEEENGLQEHVVNIYRCSKVVKGGRRFSFSALVVVGDTQGRVGVGYGKANEVPPAVEKAKKIAASNMEPIALEGTTIPHRVVGHFGASKVVLVPASAGTGVIAGASVRAVLEAAGVHDVLTKAYGSTSPKNLVQATMAGLRQLRTYEAVQDLRGVKLAMDEKRLARIKQAEARRAAIEAAEAAKREAADLEAAKRKQQEPEPAPQEAVAEQPSEPPSEAAPQTETGENIAPVQNGGQNES
ncbi:MAG: 30S ribosomal protein S5 [Phycisphaerales bacterium]|nr:MAG: 30S ribosomal protein S5 [Phycisphaerales bacterium]